MSYRKYLKDYQLEEYIDEKGRTRNRAIYVAGDYIISPAIPKGDRYYMLAASIFSWFTLIGALIPKTRASQLFYIILPFVFAALPMFFMTAGIFNLLFEDEYMTRERADKIVNRLPICPLIAAALSVAAFLGHAVTAVISWNSMLSGDILFGALSLLTAAAASFVYFRCRRVKAHKIDQD